MSKIDDVARAIYPDGPTPKSFVRFARVLHRRRSVARKAIEAMRRVTPKMIGAGDQILGVRADALHVWDAMIDAALDESET